MKGIRTTASVETTAIEKVLTPLTPSNKANDFYGFRRELQTLIARMPTHRGRVGIYARRGTGLPYVLLQEVSCGYDVRAAFVRAVNGIDFFLSSGYSEFKITITS
jgi:hypothetical protein